VLPTFVIGLREGLEAALIVGIIAAFLGQQGRKDALRQIWFGTAVAVLICIAFMKNPAQFIQLQRSLASDALNEYVQHTGSGVFACPPGLRPGQHWGDSLFT
jgi:FTR1 family protein